MPSAEAAPVRGTVLCKEVTTVAGFPANMHLSRALWAPFQEPHCFLGGVRCRSLPLLLFYKPLRIGLRLGALRMDALPGIRHVSADRTMLTSRRQRREWIRFLVVHARLRRTDRSGRRFDFGSPAHVPLKGSTDRSSRLQCLTISETALLFARIDERTGEIAEKDPGRVYSDRVFILLVHVDVTIPA